jgi:predicted methyltransferase
VAACSSQHSGTPHSSPPPQAASATPASAAQAQASQNRDAGAYAQDDKPATRADVDPEINKRFLDPELDLKRWQKTFEGESREVYASRNEVIAALKIKPGQSVADIGAGTGFYLWDFASVVGPKGHAYGVDISPRFLEHMRKQVADAKIANATIVTGSERSVELPEQSVDVVFICDTYHHFEYPQATLASIRKALRPGGTLAIVDFKRVEGESSKWILNHVRAGKEVFRKEIETAGFAFVEESKVEGLRENYMLQFRRPE